MKDAQIKELQCRLAELRKNLASRDFQMPHNGACVAGFIRDLESHVAKCQTTIAIAKLTDAVYAAITR